MAKCTPTADLDERFKFHPGTETTGPAHDRVRELCGELARTLDGMLPDSREKAMALTHAQETMWAANAAIAVHGVPE